MKVYERFFTQLFGLQLRCHMSNFLSATAS